MTGEETRPCCVVSSPPPPPPPSHDNGATPPPPSTEVSPSPASSPRFGSPTFASEARRQPPIPALCMDISIDATPRPLSPVARRKVVPMKALSPRLLQHTTCFTQKTQRETEEIPEREEIAPPVVSQSAPPSARLLKETAASVGKRSWVEGFVSTPQKRVAATVPEVAAKRTVSSVQKSRGVDESVDTMQSGDTTWAGRDFFPAAGVSLVAERREKRLRHEAYVRAHSPPPPPPVVTAPPRKRKVVKPGLTLAERITKEDAWNGGGGGGGVTPCSAFGEELVARGKYVSEMYVQRCEARDAERKAQALIARHLKEEAHAARVLGVKQAKHDEAVERHRVVQGMRQGRQMSGGSGAPQASYAVRA